MPSIETPPRSESARRICRAWCEPTQRGGGHGRPHGRGDRLAVVATLASQDHAGGAQEENGYDRDRDNGALAPAAGGLGVRGGAAAACWASGWTGATGGGGW